MRLPYTQPSFRAQNSSRSIALKDADHDGDLDFVVANDNQRNRVYLNK